MKYVLSITLSFFILFLTSFDTYSSQTAEQLDFITAPTKRVITKNMTTRFSKDEEPSPVSLYTWEDLIARIKKREGLVLKPYHCPAGYLTIGYGHLITKRDSALLKGITRAQADSLVRRDLNYCKKWVERRLPALKGTQLIAITNFCYGFGTAKLYRSRLFRYLKEGKAIDKEIMKWVNINGSPSSYLRKERVFELWLYHMDANPTTATL